MSTVPDSVESINDIIDLTDSIDIKQQQQQHYVLSSSSHIQKPVDLVDLTADDEEEDPEIVSIGLGSRSDNDTTPRFRNVSFSPINNNNNSNDSPIVVFNSPTSSLQTQFQPDTHNYLNFLGRIVDENWKWANEQEDADKRASICSLIIDFLNGRVNLEEYIRNLDIDKSLPPQNCAIVLQYALELWLAERKGREVTFEDFYAMTSCSSSSTSSIDSLSSSSSSSISPSSSFHVPSSQEYFRSQEPVTKKRKLSEQDNLESQQLQDELTKERELNVQLKKRYESKCQELDEHTQLLNNTFVGSLLKAVCPVCLEKLSTFAQKDIKVTPCKHIVCATCLHKCKALRGLMCPVCRTKFTRPKIIDLCPS